MIQPHGVVETGGVRSHDCKTPRYVRGIYIRRWLRRRIKKIRTIAPADTKAGTRVVTSADAVGGVSAGLSLSYILLDVPKSRADEIGGSAVATHPSDEVMEAPQANIGERHCGCV